MPPPRPVYPQQATFWTMLGMSQVDPQETFGLHGLAPRPNLNSLAYTRVREKLAHC